MPSIDQPRTIATPLWTCANNDAIRNFFLLDEYRCKSQFFDTHPLEARVGFVVVLAFGLLFGLATVGLVYLDQYFFRRTMNSEFFNTAGRSIKTGLTASVIVSQWTWAATLLQSTTVAFKYGISGPFWYAAGSAVQVLLFSTLAVLVKLRAPTAHTFLEIVRARWGKVAHVTFLVFALATNVIVTSMLIIGAASVVKALTDMNDVVAALLIPLGVVVYTLIGGLKATFVAAYFNTAIILITLVVFAFKVYVVSSELGSPGAVHFRLTRVVEYAPVANNRGGSYLTMFSRDGLFFGLVNLVGNFGTVFIDQSYWQSAIAATPSASWKGYLLGGLAFFAIPFSLATSLGLAAVALSLPISSSEVDQGLVPPAAAYHLMGNVGAFLLLIMLFMAVTSSGASEQIAVSSLISYDVYRTYLNPQVSGSRIIFVSRVVIFVFGVLMGGLAVGLLKAGIDLNFLYLSMGVFIGPAVVPVAYSICWGRASGRGAVAGAIGGLILGVTVWLTYGSLANRGQPDLSFIDRLKKDEVMLAGNVVSIVSSAIICTVMSLIDPDDCDWSTTKAIPLIEDDPNAHIPFEAEELLEKALKKIGFSGLVITLLLIVVWPALTLPVGVFSKGYFMLWVIVSFGWGLVSCAVMILLPLWESRQGVLVVLSCGMYTPKMKGRTRGPGEDDNIDDFIIEER